MENTATVIRADGSMTALERRPSYDEAAKIIDGYIEIAHGQDEIGRFQMLVDEDGISRGLPHNKAASMIYKVSPIFGTVIVLRGWRWS